MTILFDLSNAEKDYESVNGVNKKKQLWKRK